MYVQVHYSLLILWAAALKGIGKAHIMGIVSKKRAHIMGSSRISSTDVQSHHRIYHAHYFHPMRIIVLYHCTISFHSVLYMDCGVEYWIGFQNYCCVLSGDDLGWCSYKVTTMATAQQASCWPCLVVFRKQFYPCTATVSLRIYPLRRAGSSCLCRQKLTDDPWMRWNTL